MIEYTGIIDSLYPKFLQKFKSPAMYFLFLIGGVSRWGGVSFSGSKNKAFSQDIETCPYLDATAR